MEFLVSYGWYALLIAVIGDLLFSTILSCFYKDYNSIKMSISVLGNPQSPVSISVLGNPQSPVKLPFNCWMFLEGFFFLFSLPALYNHYRSVSVWMTIVLMIIITVFAVGACIFTAFFSVNKTKSESTTSSKIHGVGSVIGFTLFLFVPLLIALLSFINGEMLIGVISVICFVLAITFFSLFVMSDKEKFADTIISSEGLWQRFNLIFMYLPLAIISVKNIVI